MEVSLKPVLVVVLVLFALIAGWGALRSRGNPGREAEEQRVSIAEKSESPTAPLKSGRQKTGDESLTDPLISREALPSATPAENKRSESERITTLSKSFLTDKPDLFGMNEMVRELGKNARVMPGSVAREKNAMLGRILVAQNDLRGTFRIENGRYQLKFEMRDRTLEPALSRFLVRFEFDETEGNADDVNITVQFEPDEKRRPSEVLAENEERCAGWKAKIGPRGTKAEPVAMRRGERGDNWYVGKPIRLEPFEDRFLQDTTPYNLWLNLLRPLRP